MPRSQLSIAFSRLAKRTSSAAGHPVAFLVAAALILGWLAAGPIFKFSDTWQLVINTTTTIITFLMVFLIQNSQNRDSAAIQIKLDELIRAMNGAHNALLDLEELDADELARIRTLYGRLAAKGRASLRAGGNDTEVFDVDARDDAAQDDDARDDDARNERK